MSRTKIFITIITGVLALTMAMFAGVASAAPNETNCAFTGTATLPEFPAEDGENGTFSGTIDCVGTVSISGTMTADFSYSEPAATCPATGTADGTFSINNGAVTGDFAWDRVGATAAIVISNVDGEGFTNGSGAGEAAFDPEETPVTCDGSPITALVAGSAQIVDTD